MKLRSASLSGWWVLAIALLSANIGAQGAEQPPTVRSFVINGGNPQRSMVTSISIVFSADVGASLQAGDLHLTNLTMNTALNGAQFTYSAATRTGTWTFPAEFGKSLPDGNYLAFLRPADVVGPTGLQLVPNAGSTTWSTKFFRYFGDFDGDRDVDFLDTAKMRETNEKKFRQRDFNPAADVNGDGKIDDTDLGAFKEHYLSVLSGQTFAPVIVGAPVRTNQQTITIRGKAAPNTRVIITNGFLTFEGMSDENGDFAIVVGLLSNRINSLFVAGEGFTMTDFSALTPVTITQDSTPPFLYVDSPADQSTIDTATVTVTGRVGDLLSGFDGLTVKVNQVNANITAGIGPNGTFEAKNIPLALGENFLAVIATDGLGTSVTKSVMVTRVVQLQMGIVSANDQTAVRNSELPAPLVVRVRDTNGQPFANKIVNFQVTRSDGHVSPTQGQTTLTGPMLAQARTDAQGLARTYWRLGSDSGKSNNLLIATSAGVPGQASFLASADPRPPTQINVGMGNNQIGEAGGVAPLPLTAWASDNLNGAPNVPVTFTVTSGDAKVGAKDQVNAAASVIILTDSTGHVDAYLHFGTTGGPVTVEATFTGLQSNPAVFIARALVRKPGQPASFNGVVQDNTGLAIGGATCTLNINGIKIPAVISDANGFFSFPNVNPGAGFVQIDGRTANKLGGQPFNEPGRFPSLVYRIAIVPNAENPLPTTVYLPTLNPANERSYDGTKDVDLTIERIAGLKMTIKAGSMTLADGTKPTAAKPVTVSLNQVHADNIPMPIQDGVAPLLTWTLQPPGAHFDPPVEVEYPNMTGLVPGSFTNFLSYNHDIERFEIVASGAVSADGSIIKTDPGTGLLNSGWGCNCPPYAVTGECKKDSDCTVTITNPAQDDIAVSPNKSLTITTTSTGSVSRYIWKINGALQSSTGSTLSFSQGTQGKFVVSVSAECKSESGATRVSTPDTVIVYILDPKFDPAKLKTPNVPGANGYYRNLLGRDLRVLNRQFENGTEMTQFLIGDWTGALADAKKFLEWNYDGGWVPSPKGVLFQGAYDNGDLTIFDKPHLLVRLKGSTESDEVFFFYYSKATSDNYTQWKQDYQDTSWIKGLPKPYSSIEINFLGGVEDPEPAPLKCFPQRWESRTLEFQWILTKIFHPGAEHEFRSLSVGTHRHQATYNAGGGLIRSGLGAGSADFSSGILDHLRDDVKPFVRAAQLDGNPVELTDAGLSLTRQLAIQGTELGFYSVYRPALTSQTVLPGQCSEDIVFP
jgi:hypothetical protein